MKNTMPRLIDEMRFRRKVAAGCAAFIAVVFALLSYDVYMRPYRVRRAKLRAVAADGRAELERFRGDYGGDAVKRLQEALSRVGALELPGTGMEAVSLSEIDPSVYVEKDKAAKLASVRKEVAQSASNALHAVEDASALAAAVMRKSAELEKDPGRGAVDAAASALEQCLREIEMLHSQPRPKARATSDALERFETAYAAMGDARAERDKWLSSLESAISKANNAIDKAQNATKLMKEVRERANAFEEEFKTLHVDTTGVRERSLSFAAELEKRAGNMRKDVASTWEKANEAGNAATAVLEAFGKRMNAAAAKMETLLQEHGDSIPDAQKTAMKEARDGFEKREIEIRSRITAWTDDGGNGVARSGLLASAQRMEKLAKALRDGTTDWEAAKDEAATFKSVDGLRTDANVFIADMGKISDDIGAFLQKANASVVAAEKSIPDWRAKTIGLNEARNKLVTDIEEAAREIRDILNGLDAYHAEGNRLSDIRDSLTRAKNSLEGIKVEDEYPLAMNGREYEQCEKRQKGFAEAAGEAIGNGRDSVGDYKKAIDNGTLFKVFYKSGAEVCTEATAGLGSGNKIIAPGSGNGELNLGQSVKEAGLRPNVPLKNFGWKFAVKIPEPGVHKLTISLSTVSGKLVNVSAKGKRSTSGAGSRGRVLNGKIDLSYSFTSKNDLFKIDGGITKSRPKFGNGQELKKQIILSSDGTISESWAEIAFSIDSILLDVEEHSPYEDTSWDYDPITFTVTLDGAEAELYHAERGR